MNPTKLHGVAALIGFLILLPAFVCVLPLLLLAYCVMSALDFVDGVRR